MPKPKPTTKKEKGTMKKADITKATSNHDTCAIFEVQRGGSGSKRYARLMTEEEKQQQNPTGRVVYRSSSAPKVWIVYVDAISNDGETCGSPTAWNKMVATTFVTANMYRWGQKTQEKEIDSVLLARIKRCVNETQSFADFFNAEVTAMKDAGKRAKQAEENRKQVAENYKNRINDLNARVVQLGLTDTRSVSETRSYYGISNEVSISIDRLTELVRLAEQARLTEMVGA
jgi:hypothetical protein